MIHEAREGLSWFRAKVSELKQGTETRMKDLDEEMISVREELSKMNEENQHLHEMVVFLGKQQHPHHRENAVRF